MEPTNNNNAASAPVEAFINSLVEQVVAQVISRIGQSNDAAGSGLADRVRALEDRLDDTATSDEFRDIESRLDELPDHSDLDDRLSEVENVTENLPSSVASEEDVQDVRRQLEDDVAEIREEIKTLFDANSPVRRSVLGELQAALNALPRPYITGEPLSASERQGDNEQI